MKRLALAALLLAVGVTLAALGWQTLFELAARLRSSEGDDAEPAGGPGGW